MGGACADSGGEGTAPRIRLRWSALADAAADRAHTRFIVSDDPDEVADKIAFYVELGFTDLVFHFPGEDQDRALDQFAADVLPVLRERWG